MKQACLLLLASLLLLAFQCSDLGEYVDQTVTFSGEVSPYTGPELVVPAGTERYSLSELVLN